MIEEAIPVRGERAKRWMKIAASLIALVATVWVVGAGPVWERLRRLDVGWLGVALAITLLQFVLLAARWWFVALRLEVPMTYRRALGEYYLSVLLNNVLPFGVLGDALRAVRHADGHVSRRSGAPPGDGLPSGPSGAPPGDGLPSGPSGAPPGDGAALGRGERPVARVVLAILIERASGQIALWLVAIAVAPDLWRAASLTTSDAPALQAGVAIALVAAAIAAWAFGRRWWSRVREAATAGRQVLFRPSNLLVHLPISFALVATHVALFVVAARAIGLDLALGAAVRIVPPVLVAATLPALFGGFGTREAAAAGLYHLTGLRAADGATISFVYGSMSLLASVPGILTLPWRDSNDAPPT